MKQSFKLLSLLSVLLLAASCGKKSGGGGGGSSNSGSNAFTGSPSALTGNSVGTDAINKLNVWIAATETLRTFTAGTILTDKRSCSGSIFVICTDSVDSDYKVWGNNLPRSYNTVLANILTPETGYSVLSVSQSGASVVIIFTKTDGSDIYLKQYMINTGVHAVYQPVQYVYTKNGQLKERKTVR
jgi:hypothetical protein